MTRGLSEATITAQNTGTEAIRANQTEVNATGDFETGFFTGTVHLQRRFIDNGVAGNWIDVESYIATFNKIIEEVEADVEYRLFVKTGNFSGTSAYLRLSF